MNGQLNIVRYSELPQGGFAGIVEKQLVKNSRLWLRSDKIRLSDGLGDFVYLSIGHFMPNDGVPLHSHKDIDIVSFVYSGEIGHKGSLGDGSIIQAPGVQVQRSGSGMTHSEFNTSNQISKFAQVWFLAPDKGLEPRYQNFSIHGRGLTNVYGGKEGTFDGNMTCKIGFLDPNTVIEIEGKYVAVLFEGLLNINNKEIKERDLFEGKDIKFKTLSKIGLILIEENTKESI